MKHFLMIIFLMIIFLTLAVSADGILCFAANPTIKFIEDKEEPSEYEIIESVIQKYEKNLVRAVNEGYFNLIEPYLLPDGALYNGQKSLVKQLYQREIKERFISCEILEFEMVNAQKYRVYVNVMIGFVQRGKPEIRKDFQWVYTVEKANSQFKLSNIEEWKDYQKYVEEKMADIKAEGYYAKELMRYYGIILQDAMNTLNITQIKKISGTKSVFKAQKNIIVELHKYGLEFKLSQYEVIPHDDQYNRCMITMQFLPVQSSNQLQSVTLKYQFTLKEIRKNYGGYAVITEIKKIR